MFDRVTPRDGIRHATVAGSYAMSLDLANVIHRQIYMGCFANAMTRWAKALLRPGGSFLDVGAHAGYFSLIAADRVGRDGRVFAVEPNPVGFRDAASAPGGERDRAGRRVQLGPGRARGIGRAVRASRRELFATTTRRCFDGRTGRSSRSAVRRLDDCLDDWGVERIDLMKIDVEGAEPRVLAGGAAHLANGVVRHAMIEINGPRLVEAGSSPAALVEDLTALGFEPARLVSGRAVRVARTDIDLDPAHERDCLFVHGTALGVDARRHGLTAIRPV